MDPNAERLAAAASHPAPRPRVEQTEKDKKTRRGGNRGRARRSTLRQINGKARDRQNAWAETGQRDWTEQLTVELDELYGELRDERKGAKVDPSPVATSSGTRQWISETTR